MNSIERARLKPGKRLFYNGKTYRYRGYRYRAHGLLQEGVSRMVVFPNGFISCYPVWEELSNEEILTAEIA